MEAKEWWKSKTLWFGILLFLTGVANLFGLAEWEPTPELVGAVTALVGIVEIVLRLMTKKPLR